MQWYTCSLTAAYTGEDGALMGVLGESLQGLTPHQYRCLFVCRRRCSRFISTAVLSFFFIVVLGILSNTKIYVVV